MNIPCLFVSRIRPCQKKRFIIYRSWFVWFIRVYVIVNAQVPVDLRQEHCLRHLLPGGAIGVERNVKPVASWSCEEEELSVIHKEMQGYVAL